MAYIDYEYYTEEYKGVEIPENEFVTLSERASDFVDIKTFFKIEDILALADKTQARVKKATAMYVEQFYQQGSVDAYTGFSASMSNSSRIGSTSIDGGGQNLSTTGGIVDNPIADQLLISTGLCYKGCC